MFDWSGKNADKSGKSQAKIQGILISCVSGNLDKKVVCHYQVCQLRDQFSTTMPRRTSFSDVIDRPVISMTCNTSYILF